MFTQRMRFTQGKWHFRAVTEKYKKFTLSGAEFDIRRDATYSRRKVCKFALTFTLTGSQALTSDETLFAYTNFGGSP